MKLATMVSRAHGSEEQVELDQIVRALIDATAEAIRAIALGETPAACDRLQRAREVRKTLAAFERSHQKLASENLFACCGFVDAKLRELEQRLETRRTGAIQRATASQLH